MAETTTAVATTAKKTDIGTMVISRVGDLASAGFTMPADYNHVNAIKASFLMLTEMRDRDGKSPLETCTKESIQTALFDMATKGLDVSKKQGYFIKRGNKLCLDEGYFGDILQVRRVYPNFDPEPRVIYQGDEFVYDTDPATGRKRLVKHEQKLENTDNDFVGAYMYIPCADGGQKLYTMTRKEIYEAWNQSGDKNHTTHKRFPAKMIGKTIIKSACSTIINATPSLQVASVSRPIEQQGDYEEPMQEPEIINVDDAEVVEVAVAEQPSDSKEKKHGELYF